MFKDECHQRLAMTMAGKAAEILKYGADAVSNGPAGDIMQASALARAMVMRWGMSDKVGNIDYSEAADGLSGNTGGLLGVGQHQGADRKRGAEVHPGRL